ncbi:thioredoxin domain-containing protein [Cellulomonas sp. zg-ZUI199]|uniref:Thioredoxin domain-containing protein n=1 Tax=Cellulomonas wangleii TaxID=2816956 RepID=A0ABX8D822_9CELL|nr:thioredoxin domain-containing protein [Cellulomonas wangleii]MBO0923906.1 thioredoxin domain-containing protein [Cellulomonas wangleii]MBO0924188.1 thioredoxin domain-containing protein [Cellulomonas wangleii]QVI62207.1 thioredoxin domain-containing protein [Cellulomonas wangleii]
MPNRLATASSPYLLQHADNPVDWWEWGDDAFAEARRRDVPLLVSVGYAACHWCHVMAHESFEDPATAAFMNEHFVCVKVDREERPDVDAVYMTATQAMTGSGGWPMTVFTTPDGKPFYCGTYFPPRRVGQVPSFPEVLAALAAAWTTRRDEVVGSASSIAGVLARRPPTDGITPTADDVDERVTARALGALGASFDEHHGGFGGAPKFPPSTTLEWLLRHHARTGDADALAMARGTLDAMAGGGMYDQLAGGFARYSVDATWTVPHFEKMLYDNALLLRAYLHAWRLTGEPTYRRVATQTADWLLADLRTPEGGFASALDADSEGREGAFYAWTPQQLRDALGDDDGAWAADVLGVTRDGTFEHGASVLQLRRAPDDAARYAAVRDRLRRARAARPWPARDDKVVTAWNGLAVAALAEAGALLDRPDLVAAARDCAQLLADVHTRTDPAGGDRLVRTSRGGTAGHAPGVLEDYADVADGYLVLAAVTGEHGWTARAHRLTTTVLAHFRDDDGALFDTADDETDSVLGALMRPQDPTDGPTPSGAAAAAAVLVTLGALTGDLTLREAALAALRAPLGLAGRYPQAAGWALATAEALLDGPREVAVVGPPDDPAARTLHRVALTAPAPGLVVTLGDPAHLDPDAPALLRDRPLVDGRPAAYVCRGFVCERPTTDAEALTQQLRA